MSRVKGGSTVDVRQRQFFLDKVGREGLEAAEVKFEEERLVEAMKRQQEEVAWAMDKVAGAVEMIDKSVGERRRKEQEIVDMRLEIVRLKEAVVRLEGECVGRGEEGGEKEEEEDKIKKVDEDNDDPIRGNFIDVYLQNRYDHAYFKERLKRYGGRLSDPLEKVTYPSKFVYNYGNDALRGGEFEYGYAKGGWSEAMMKAGSLQRGKQAVGWHLLGRSMLSKHTKKNGRA